MARLEATSRTQLDIAEVERVRAFFTPPPYETLDDIDAAHGRELEFQTWYRYNTRPHKVPRLSRGVRVA